MHTHELDIERSSTSPGTGQAERTLKRKRITYSCQACRKKKIKCDTGRPCGACQAMSIICSYPDQATNDLPSTPDTGKVFDLKSRLDGLEYKIDCLLGSLSESLSPVRQDTGPSDIESLRDTRVGPSNSNDIREHDVFSWPAIRPFLTAAELARASNGNFISSYECRNWDTQPEHLPEIADGRIIDALLEVFYRQVHIKHPLFELDIARRCREQNYNIGYDALGATVSTMIALGSLVAEGSRSHLKDYQDRCIAMAERRMQLSLLGMTLENVRIIYLYGMLQLYRFRWWPYVQMVNLAASKMAIIHSLGGPSNVIDTTTLLEQRLYWSCLKGEEEVQFIWQPYRSILVPDQSSELSYPIPPAGTYDPYGLIEESWFYYLSEIAAHKMRHRDALLVLEARNSQPFESAEAILRRRAELDMQRQSWYESLPEFLQFPTDPRLEIRHHIETRPHLRTYYFGILAMHATAVIYHGLHNNLDASYDECLRIAIQDIRNGMMIHVGQQARRLHFGTYFLMRHLVHLIIVLLLCLHSPRFIGLVDQAAEQEALDALDSIKSFLGDTISLKKGLEVLTRIQDELSSAR